MNIPSLECPNCSSKQIRRARYQNWGERLRGILGVHPFRCRKCTHRFLVSIWLFGKLRYAKCPRCLRLELTTWSRRYYKVGFMKNFLVVFGAQKYRCPACRCNFVSFRPRKAIAKSAEQPETIPGMGLTRADVGDDAVQPRLPREEVPREDTPQTARLDGEPSEPGDPPDQTSASQIAEPAAIHFNPASPKEGSTPESAPEEQAQAEPLKGKSRVRSSALRRTARKKTANKTLTEQAPQQASDLLNG